MQRLTYEYGHRSNADLVPGRNVDQPRIPLLAHPEDSDLQPRPSLPGRPRDPRSPLLDGPPVHRPPLLGDPPSLTLVDQQPPPLDETPKPEINGRAPDPNISEKITKLITRLPQLGKSIKIKKKGEYIPIPILEKEAVNEQEDHEEEEEIEGYDLDDMNDNASYWTSGFEW